MQIKHSLTLTNLDLSGKLKQMTYFTNMLSSYETLIFANKWKMMKFVFNTVKIDTTRID